MEVEFSDQIGGSISLPRTPKKIISLVPSQTELLFDLGLDEEVVGVTEYCVHPGEKTRTRPKVGGTKTPDLAAIARLTPDLIIGNKEENRREDIERLRDMYPVWVSDVASIEDAVAMIESVGEVVGRGEEAAEIARAVIVRMDELRFPPNVRAAYLIWRKPYMAAGADTFVNDMLSKCGFINVFDDFDGYPEVTEESILSAAPQVILLSTEPFPFKERHVEEFERGFPGSRTLLVDGEMFSWFGSRMVFAADYFISLRREIEGLLGVEA